MHLKRSISPPSFVRVHVWTVATRDHWSRLIRSRCRTRPVRPSPGGLALISWRVLAPRCRRWAAPARPPPNATAWASSWRPSSSWGAPACSPGGSSGRERARGGFPRPDGCESPQEAPTAGVARTRPRRRRSATPSNRARGASRRIRDASEAMPVRKRAPVSQRNGVSSCDSGYKFCPDGSRLAGSVDLGTRSQRHP